MRFIIPGMLFMNALLLVFLPLQLQLHLSEGAKICRSTSIPFHTWVQMEYSCTQAGNCGIRIPFTQWRDIGYENGNGGTLRDESRNPGGVYRWHVLVCWRNAEQSSSGCYSSTGTLDDFSLGRCRMEHCTVRLDRRRTNLNYV